MIIQDKICNVFDIEVLRNVFTCTCKDTENHCFRTFEVSARKNEIKDLIKYFLSNKYIFVGYNNIHFDNPVVNYIIEFFNNDKFTFDQITHSLFTLSQIIIKDKDIDKWKRWKYANNFATIDLLTMLYSTALRVSLKDMQITMQYHKVQEFTVDWNEDLPLESIDKLIEYNINDVDSTSLLLEKCKDLLDLRVNVEEEYGIKALSKDRVNLGMEILKHEYLKATGKNWNDIKDLRSPCDFVDLEKIILPIVKYKNPILQKVLTEAKKQHSVSPERKGYENTFLFGGLKVTIGVGGIHGDCGKCIIKPQADELLIDSDVTSLYPSIMIEHKFYPPHLGIEFLDVYTSLKTRRVTAKNNKKFLRSETFKYGLNGLTGNLQQEYSWCYSPYTVMQIRINGQLLLLMLCERLLEIGCSLKQINTDGILYICKKDKEEECKRICKEWEKETKLGLEHEYFNSFYQLAVNDYFGVHPDGKIKKKGIFLTEIELGKGLSPKIIPETIINYFVHNIPIEETIKNCTDIRKFLQGEKTGKQWKVEYNNKIQQRTNRFYVSESGYYLWKFKNDTGITEYHNMLKGYGVKIHNDFYTDDILNSFYSQGMTFQDIYDINYSYYIVECKKIIDKLKPKQLSLW